MKSIDAYEFGAVVDSAGCVQIGSLPFAAGDRVRVLVMREVASAPPRHTDEEIRRSKTIRDSLQGSVVRDDAPFDAAVPAEDWDAIGGTGLI